MDEVIGMLDVVRRAFYLWGVLIGIILAFVTVVQFSMWLMYWLKQKLLRYNRYAVPIAGAIVLLVLCFIGSLINYVIGG